LRREKELAEARFEVIQAETNRLRQQVINLQKQADAAEQALAEERQKTEVNSPFFVYHCITQLLCSIDFLCFYVLLWPGGVMVRVLACETKGHRFDSWPFHFQVTTLGKLFTHMSLSSKLWYWSRGSDSL